MFQAEHQALMKEATGAWGSKEFEEMETNFAAILRFLSQETISMNEEGDLVYPLFGKPAVWREVEPFVWRRVGGYERLAAVLHEDGSLDYVTFEPVSPIMHLLPAPWYRASSLVTPLLGAALGRHVVDHNFAVDRLGVRVSLGRGDGVDQRPQIVDVDIVDREKRSVALEIRCRSHTPDATTLVRC